MLAATPPILPERASVNSSPPASQRDAISRVLEAKRMAAVDDSDDGPTCEAPISQKRPESCIQNEAGFVESILIADVEPLPQKHPLTQWLYEAFEEMYSDEENVVIYLAPQSSVNAFCLANGSIFVSMGLVELCDSKETLQFVLGHEYNHYKRGHFTFDMGRFKGIYSVIGTRRLNEYEGDLGAVNDMEEAGINPYGAVDFFRKLMVATKPSRGVSVDLVHGNLEDRLLNIETVLHMKDFKELSKNLTAYPEAIRQGLSETPPCAIRTLGRRESLAEDMALIPHFSFGHLVAYFDRLRGLHMELAPQFERESLAACYKAGLARLRELIRAQGSYADAKACEFSASLLAQLATSVPLTLTQSVIPKQFYPARLVSESKDLKLLMAVLKSEYFEALGAYCIADPLDFAKQLLGQLLEQGQFQKDGRLIKKDYQAFVKELTVALQALYEERGLEVVELDSTWRTKLAALAVSYSDKNKEKSVLPVKVPKTAKAGLSLSACAPHLLTDISTSVSKQLDWIANGKFSDIAVSVWLEGHSQAEIEADLISLNRLASAVFRDSNAQRMRNERQDKESTELLVRNEENPLKLYNDKLCEYLNRFNLQVLNGLKQQGHFSNLKEMFGFFEKCGCRRVFDQNQTYAEFESKPLIEEMHGELMAAVLLPGSFEEMCEVYETYFSARRVGSSDTEAYSYSPTEVWWHLVTVPLLYGHDVIDKEKVTQIMATLIRVNPDFLEFFKEHRHEAINERINIFLGRIFKAHSLDLADSPADARLLFYSSFLMHSPYLASMSQSVALRTLLATMDFEAGHEFFFEEEKKPVYAFEAINSFIESRVQTHEQFEKIRTSAEAKLKDGLNREQVGKMALADSFIDMLGTKTSQMEFYRACSMSESDLELKTLIAAVRRHDSDTDSQRVPSPLLYRSLMTADDTFKYFLVRKLLVGPKGILMERGERVTFLNHLLENEVQEPQNGQDKKILDFLREMLEQIAQVAEFDQLYFMLAPFMMRRLLVPPPKRATWEEALWSDTEKAKPEWAEYEMNEFVATDGCWLGDGWETDSVACSFNEALPALEAKGVFDDYVYSQQRVRIAESGEADEIDIADELKKVDAGLRLYDKFLHVIYRYSNFLYRLCPAIAEHIKKDSIVLAASEGVGQGAEVYADDVMKIIEKSALRLEKNKLNVFDFVLEVAQNLGSPGIRFLQLLGQYVELPPQLEASISQVYDKVHGQNRLAAYYLVEREWSEFKDQVAEVRASVGGGSLMTVYEVLMKSGERRVLKVLNPNAEEKNREIYQLMYKAFEAMGSEYADALPLIEEIQAWISHDIKFENHLVKDSEFRSKNNGFTDGSGYTISIPQSFEPESRYFKMEEFVDGRNLTDLEELKQDGHDPKKIVSLIARNYLHQLQGGLMHSDVHPGNFRITVDKQVAILDRNFALEYSPDEIERIHSVVLSMGDSNAYLDCMMDLFVGPESDEKKVFLRAALVTAITDVNDSLERTKRIILTLKRNGVKLPLKFTLLFKNIFALNHLAKRVGYSGVMEAVLG